VCLTSSYINWTTSEDLPTPPPPTVNTLYTGCAGSGLPSWRVSVDVWTPAADGHSDDLGSPWTVTACADDNEALDPRFLALSTVCRTQRVNFSILEWSTTVEHDETSKSAVRRKYCRPTKQWLLFFQIWSRNRAQVHLPLSDTSPPFGLLLPLLLDTPFFPFSLLHFPMLYLTFPPCINCLPINSGKVVLRI